MRKGSRYNRIHYTKGNDVIYGYTSTDTLEIGTLDYDTIMVGNDIVFKLPDGQFTLVGGLGKKINIVHTKK